MAKVTKYFGVGVMGRSHTIQWLKKPNRSPKSWDNKRTRVSLGSVEFRTGSNIFTSLFTDLNPIETFWANMKRWVPNKITDFACVYEALAEFVQIPM